MTSNIGDNDLSEALYASVQEYLKGTANRLNSDPHLSLTINTAMRTVNSAIADFTEVWNNDHSPVLSLPDELLVECFERLSFQGRVTASRVSRAWRATLLGNKAFWTTIAIPKSLSRERAVSRLRNLLIRSGSALLDIHWDGMPIGSIELRHPQLSGTVTQLFGQAISRTRSLVLPHMDFEVLQNHLAPALESLTTHDEPSSVICLPCQWISDCAPRLQALSVKAFTLPAQFSPLCNVSAFSGRIGATGMSHPWATRLFDVFPRLKTLELYDIRNPMELPHFAPPSLRHVILVTEVELDFSPLFDAWTAPPADGKRYIKVIAGGPHTLHAPLRHLVVVQRATAPNISIAFNSPANIALSTSGAFSLGIALTSRSRPWFNGSDTLRGCPHLGMVQSLQLSRSMLVVVLRMNAEYPAVEKLTVRDDRYLSACAIDKALRRRSVLPLRVPRLQELVFDFSAIAAPAHSPPTVSRLADFIRDCVQTSAGTLASITIVGPQDPAWKDSDISGLFAFTPAVYHRLSPNSPPRAVERNAGESAREDPWLAALLALIPSPS